MKVFGSPIEAKRFFIDKILEQARVQNQPLSELEKKMLYFTETGSDADAKFLEIARKFQEEYNDAEYEEKIVGLLKRAYQRDMEQAGKQGQESIRERYRAAYETLGTEDHYILVMITQALDSKLRKKFLGLF